MKIVNHYWKDKDGNYRSIEKMSDSYLRNAINYYMSHSLIGGEDNSLVELAKEFQGRHEAARDEYIEQLNDNRF